MLIGYNTNLLGRREELPEHLRRELDIDGSRI